MMGLVNMALLKEQLRRFWMLMVIPMLGYLLFIIFPAHWGGSTHTIRNVFHFDHALLWIFMIIVPFVVAMAIHSYHFSPKAAGFFFTLPISKAQLFSTTLATGAVIIMLPILVFSVLFAGIVVDAHSLTDVGFIAGFFMRMSLGSMVYFAIFSLAMAIAGNKVVAIILCILLPILPVTIVEMIASVGDIFIYGMYRSMHFDAALDFALRIMNPVSFYALIRESGRMFGSLQGTGNRQVIFLYTGGYVLVFVVLSGLALFCTKIRRQERTGDAVAFTWIKNALVFFVSIGGMLTMAAFMGLMLGSLLGLFFGGVLGFVLAYFVAQMVTEKNFNIFRQKGKLLLYFMAATLSGLMVIVMVTTFGLSFFVNHVPNHHQVRYVAIGQWTVSSDVSDRQTIGATIALHRQIINHRSEFTQMAWSNRARSNRAPTSAVRFVYTMENGRRHVRSYSVPRDFWQSYARPIINSAPVIIANSSFFQRAPYAVSAEVTVNRGLHDRQVHVISAVSGQDLQGFLHALEADFTRDVHRNHRNLNTRDENPWIAVRIYGEAGPLTNIRESVVYIAGYSAVLDWLDAHGLLRH